jgi:hypothetical protein
VRLSSLVRAAVTAEGEVRQVDERQDEQSDGRDASHARIIRTGSSCHCEGRHALLKPDGKFRNSSGALHVLSQYY